MMNHYVNVRDFWENEIRQGRFFVILHCKINRKVAKQFQRTPKSSHYWNLLCSLRKIFPTFAVNEMILK